MKDKLNKWIEEELKRLVKEMEELRKDTTKEKEFIANTGKQIELIRVWNKVKGL